MKRLLSLVLFAGVAVLLLPTCRTTKHTVARIITPVPVPTEVFVAPPPEPTSTPAAPVPAVAPPRRPRVPSPTPTVAAMRVVTLPPGTPPDRTPGVLYEQFVPTVAAVTPESSPMATRSVTPRSTREPRTPTPAATQKPGVYYEDEQGRPLTPTPEA